MRESLRSLHKQLLASDLVRANTVMLAGTSVISLLNYLFYPVLSRLLPAAQLGEVQVIISIITQLLFALSIGRMVILNVLANEKSPQAQKEFMREADKALARSALGLCVLVVLTAPILQHFLQLHSLWPLLLLVPIVVLSTFRGARDALLRSRLKFKQIIISDAVVSLLRIVFAAVLIQLGLGTFGAIGGLVCALAVSAYLMQRYSQQYAPKTSFFAQFKPHNLKKSIDTRLMRPHLKYAVVVAFVGLLQALIVVMDSVSAKHFFSPTTAGLYAGISIVGNIVLFVTGSIGTVLVASARTTIDHIYNVRKLAVSTGLLVFVGSFVASVFSIAPQFFVTLLLGERYTVYAYLLPKVAFTMLLLSVVNLIFAYHIALRDLYVVFAAATSIVIMIASVALSHGSLDQLVQSILNASIMLVLLNGVRTVLWNIRTLKAQS